MATCSDTLSPTPVPTAAPAPPTEPSPPVPLLKARHVKFLQRLLQVLPEGMASLETSRMTLAYFSISGLDILDALDDLGPTVKNDLIEWIYSLQVPLSPDDPSCSRAGFRGSCFLKLKDHDHCQTPFGCGALKSNSGHIAMTYTALASLIILGDDLSQVDRKSIATGLTHLQQENGGFVASAEEGENDMRFVYCACAVSYMINDWSGIDKERATKFIVSSLSYEGGFAQFPGLESHGGSTYCAVASLSLMGNLRKALTENQISKLIRWCSMRLNVGYQGRPNKPDDTCYSFWVGAALAILSPSSWTKDLTERSSKFVLSTQDPIVGGFAKWPDQHPDPLHTCLGLAGLSLGHSKDGLKPVHPALNISESAADHLHHLHANSLTLPSS